MDPRIRSGSSTSVNVWNMWVSVGSIVYVHGM